MANDNGIKTKHKREIIFNANPATRTISKKEAHNEYSELRIT